MKFWTLTTYIRRVTRKLWVSVALFALLAILTMFLSVMLSRYIPTGLSARFTPDSVVPILSILASSMLAVSTFSLNVMVSAHSAAASQATPRVRRILQEDSTTQRVLAAFIGSFVYSLGTIIMFKSGLHGPGTPFVVLLTIVAITAMIVIALLRWIDHLSDLGSMDTAVRAAEAQSRAVLRSNRKNPALGASPITPKTLIPQDARPLRAPGSGYLQLIDVAGLDSAMCQCGGIVYITLPVGGIALEGEVIGHISGGDETTVKSVGKCLTFGDFRTNEQDARNGLMILGEIASRAMSPGINDPGTATDVIARQAILLWFWSEKDPARLENRSDRVFIQDVTPRDLVQAAYASVARDGAGAIEVVTRLLVALKQLAQSTVPEMRQAAVEMAEYVDLHAEAALAVEADRHDARELVAAIRLVGKDAGNAPG